MDPLSSEQGVSDFLEWVRAPFLDVEVTKVSHMMRDLFQCRRRRSDQSVRDFNVEFDRLHFRLPEVQCDIPSSITKNQGIFFLKIPESIAKGSSGKSFEH